MLTAELIGKNGLRANRKFYRCMLDIVTITDFQSPSTDDKVQVYISGTLHGDEVIGPQVAYYLMEYLLTNYLHDP
jgi:predicted deacylase